MAGRYGHSARDVLAVAAERGELAQPIVPGGPCDLLAETVYAARREQARSVGDTLLRRTRLGLLAASDVVSPENGAAERVARAIAPELGWDEAAILSQVDAFYAEAEAEGIAAGSRSGS